jgi:ABC-2 type transport system permease protein
MVNVPVITKRELSAYFLSPIAYVMLTCFALAQGIFFAVNMRAQIDPDMTAEAVLRMPVFLLLLAIPILTMRLLSEETYHGTIETLMTTPVSEAEVVIGKFLGAMTFAVVMLAPVLAQVLFVRTLGPLDAGPLLAGFLGLLLLTGQFIAVGMLCSAFTRIQVASAIVAFVALLGLVLVGFIGRDSQASLVLALQYLSPIRQYYDFPRGVVDTRAGAYFVITTASFLFLTVKALELRKWR